MLHSNNDVGNTMPTAEALQMALKTTITTDTDAAAACLKRGGLVALPTETVYGLGADARNPEALRKLYEAKGRPSDHPVIVHLADASQMHDWAIDIPPIAWTLAEIFWPGPLTLVLSKAEDVLNMITGGQNTVAVRVPEHPMMRAVLRAFGGGIAAPSANRFGRLSPTTAQHVLDDMNGRIDMVLDGGPCTVGIESAIVDLTGEVPRLLRPGGITSEALTLALQRPLRISAPEDATPRVPGSLQSHYAPHTPLMLVNRTVLAQKIDEATQAGQRIAVVAHFDSIPSPRAAAWETMLETPEAYAQDLYATLHKLDTQGYDAIWVEAVPTDDPAWAGVADRLNRAASAREVDNDG